MKQFDNQAAQGDILINRIKTIPDNAIKQTADNGKHVVAHSETGHHHTVASGNVDFFRAANDPMIMYLAVDNDTPLIHNRSFDTHEPINLSPGLYEIRRQREHTPDGWRRIED